MARIYVRPEGVHGCGYGQKLEEAKEVTNIQLTKESEYQVINAGKGVIVNRLVSDEELIRRIDAAQNNNKQEVM